MNMLWLNFCESPWRGALQSLILRNLFCSLEGNIYYVLYLGNTIKPQDMKKHLLSGKFTYVLSVVWVNKTIKWKKKKKETNFKNTFRKQFSKFFAFLLEIHCLSFSPHLLLKNSLYLSLIHPRDWRPLTLLYFKLF